MDWNEAWRGISRDLHELATTDMIGLLILASVGGLLVASLIAAVVWRSRVAWLALALGLVPFAFGALYYGAGRWSNQGAQGIVYVVTPVLAGWAVLGGVGLARIRRHPLVARSG